MATITTSIRWEKEELEDIKKAAKAIGLPVSLYVKSEALRKARTTDQQTLLRLVQQADQEIALGEYDTFDSVEELIKNLDTHKHK